MKVWYPLFFLIAAADWVLLAKHVPPKSNNSPRINKQGGFDMDLITLVIGIVLGGLINSLIWALLIEQN